MIFRTADDVEAIRWGNGISRRLLTASDNMGFTVAHTIVFAGSESYLQYRRHLEACYSIAGSGKVYTADRRLAWSIVPGTLYALDEHDPHILVADERADLHLISVFRPALIGHERHTLSTSHFSEY